MERKDISNEEYREYDFISPSGLARVYRIDKPKALYVGNTTHRVIDSDGVAHCVPAPGHQGCILRWKQDGEVSF